MALNQEELKLVKDSWAEIIKIGELEIGLFMLLRLLEVKPGVRKHYTMVPEDMEVKLSEMKKVRPVRVQCAKIGSYASKLFNSIETPETYNSIIEYLASVHAKHNVDSTFFEVIGDVIVDVIAEVMQCARCCDLMQAWRKLGSLVQDDIIAAMNANKT